MVIVSLTLELALRALSVVWTTPLVATLGMSLTIPLAMVADMIIHGRHYSAVYILGSVQVQMYMSSLFYFIFNLDLCKKSTICNNDQFNCLKVFLEHCAVNLFFWHPMFNSVGLFNSSSLLHTFNSSFDLPCGLFFRRYFQALLLQTLQIAFHVL